MPSALETRSLAGAASGTTISPLAGKPAPKEMLVDVARLEQEYFDRQPDVRRGSVCMLDDHDRH